MKNGFYIKLLKIPCALQIDCPYLIFLNLRFEKLFYVLLLIIYLYIFCYLPPMLDIFFISIAQKYTTDTF